MIEQLNAVQRDCPKSAIHNLKQIANDLLEDEKEMVVNAWLAGNQVGWDMQSDWPEDAARYYDQQFPPAPTN